MTEACKVRGCLQDAPHPFTDLDMKHYIDAERLKEQIQGLINLGYDKLQGNLYHVLNLIDSLQQEQQMPDSTQLIAEWKKEKAVLEQKDFRGDAERMAYNAFLDGFVKGLGYGRTE